MYSKSVIWSGQEAVGVVCERWKHAGDPTIEAAAAQLGRTRSTDHGPGLPSGDQRLHSSRSHGESSTWLEWSGGDMLPC